MANYVLEKDIHVFYVTASSFPNGVLAAHQQLHAYVDYDSNRKYFGISAPDKTGTIIYKAAAEELKKGELSKHQLQEFIIKKGNYIYIDIKDFMKDVFSIGKAFDELISNQAIDPKGCCIEWYLTQNDVRCMVRLNN